MSKLETTVEDLDKLNNLDGEEPLASHELEPQPTQPSAYGAPLPPFDPERAIAALDWLCQQDPEEQRETFEYLKQALNQERAASGERLLFLDE